MSYSRRQLEALGEPLGDSATRMKDGGFGRIYGGGGGGGGGAPAAQTQTQVSDLPEWSKPYAQDVLAKGQALTQTPYQAYGGQRIAGFTPMQEQAFQGAANLGPTEQTAMGSGLAAAAGAGALGTQYQTGRFGAQQVQAPWLQQYQMQQPEDVQGAQAQAAQAGYSPDLQTFQMGPAQQVRTQSFARPGTAESFMSPYMQNVVDVQQREAQRQSDILGTQQAAQATQAGAFGGARQGIVEAERQRNLATQLGQIQATGLQSAYQQAQQQFNTEQQARLAAQQANQQAGLTVGGQNLAAALGVQQLGTQTGLQTALANQQAQQQASMQNAQLAQQAALANQQAGLTTGQQNLAALLGVQNLGAGQSLQAQQLNQAANLQAQQLREQSRQYGAGLGLQGLQTGLQAAGTLGGLGAQQFAQQQGAIQAQQAAGAQQQAQQQKAYDTAYQDYLTQLNYPYQQLSYMSNLIRGTPMGMNTQSQVYQAPPTAVQSIGSLGLGAYGLSKLFGAEGGLMKSYADGGQVKGYADGDIVGDTSVADKFNDVGYMTAQMSRLSDAQLQEIVQNPTTQAEGAAAQQELNRRNEAMMASERNGLAGAYNQMPYSQQENMVRAAGGGILAFDGDTNGSVTYGGGDGYPENDGQQNVVSRGNPRAYGAMGDRLIQLVNQMDADKGYVAPDPEQRRAGIRNAYNEFTQFAGADPYAPMQARLEEQESERGKALEQGKGLAALQAAQAILQPGGTLRGIGAAGAAFGSAYGQALQADRAEKRYLAQMQFSLADAQRKERLGLTKDAITDYQNSEAAKVAAIKARDAKNAAMGNILARGMQATKPTGAGGGAGKLPQVDRQAAVLSDKIANLEATQPDSKELPLLKKQLEGRMKILATGKDVGPGKAAIDRLRIESTADTAVETEVQDNKWGDPAWRAAQRDGDAAGMAAAEDNLARAIRNRRQAGKGGAGEQKNPSAGKTDYSNLWSTPQPR